MVCNTSKNNIEFHVLILLGQTGNYCHGYGSLRTTAESWFSEFTTERPEVPVREFAVRRRSFLTGNLEQGIVPFYSFEINFKILYLAVESKVSEGACLRLACAVLMFYCIYNFVGQFVLRREYFIIPQGNNKLF